MSDLMSAVRSLLEQNPQLAAGMLGQGNGMLPSFQAGGPSYSPASPQSPGVSAPLATGPGRFGLSPESMAQWGVNMPQGPQPLAPLADPAIGEALERARQANAATRQPEAAPANASSAGGNADLMAVLPYLSQAQNAMQQGYQPDRFGSFGWGGQLSDSEMQMLKALAGAGIGGR